MAFLSCGQQFSLRPSLVLTSTSAARYVMNMSDEMLDLISLQPDTTSHCIANVSVSLYVSVLSARDINIESQIGS